ncbi:tRNA lysidine(34) synthetase TilS [Deminuibacter soli]|uniref:tRNA(Ile)-lysidine synthase n=1 Tax=Deminuibacter soli TaxID=2291815 RepID=A0A3E1NI38_9BACT|nr:tRNA lysidine(34) synthetase TilS [Deminuibacter soli]RFM27606.1 tRNA lysidine(34) synthetase TilS [Deminuibacter soli]
MDVAEQLKVYWKQQFPNLDITTVPLLVAVSGGIDSVVLTDVLHKAGALFVMAHCNFQLRGEESERDEQFVHELAAGYNKELLVQRFDTKQYAEQNKLSVQEAARELRYNWFQALVNDNSITIPGWKGRAWIATAHHANDSIETLLINFFRGTGIGGLHGILPLQGNIIRPLLFATREQVKQYAQQHALRWVEDSSNASDKYVRNHFRLNLIPGLQQVFPNVEQNLLQNIERFRDAELLYKQAVQLHTRKLLEYKGDEVHIPVYKLLQLQPLTALVWEICKPYGFSVAQTPEIIKLLHADNGSYTSSATHRVIRNRNWLIIAPRNTEQPGHILITSAAEKIIFAGGTLQFGVLPNSEAAISTQPQVACLNAAAVQFPLLLRPWRQGDYFYPLGMPKKKKISRFLIDQKLSATDKEKVWVLESNQRIVWVVGRRIDDRFKVTQGTRSVISITLR